MTNEDNTRKPYDFEKDTLTRKEFKDKDKVKDDAVFLNTVNQHFSGQRSFEQAQNATKANVGKSPVMPKGAKRATSKFFSKSKLHYHGKMKDRKKHKMPASLTLLLASAFLVGNIALLHYINNKEINKDLATSQNTLQNMLDREASLHNLNIYQEENNSLQILNANLNNILERYEQDHNSVSKDEIAQLLQNIYEEGKDISLPKLADAYNSYQNSNNSSKISPDDLQYVYTPRDSGVPCSVALYNINTDSYTYLFINSEQLSDFVASQFKISSSYGIDENGNAELLCNVPNALLYAKMGTAELNNLATSTITYSKPKLAFKEYDNEISDTNSTKASNVNDNLKDSSDKGDEER